jgi:hypothetical protein
MKMTEEEKKKKKGVAIVIAVTPHAPKKPEDTSKPDEKMKKAWATLKADPQQQLVAPQQVNTQGYNWAETSSRFMPQGTLHPAITGMMERQGIKQPNIMQYEQGTYAQNPTQNPVQRMQDAQGGGALQPENPQQAPTHTGPAFHGEEQTWFGKPGETQAPFMAQAIDPSVRDAQPMPLPMAKAWTILKRRAWSNKIMPALGITPREHEQRMLNDMAAVGRDEYAQGRYQRGELPKHMIDTEEQQENEEFFADDLDMPEIDEDDPFIGDTSSRKPKPEDYHRDPFEMYEMFRQD